MAKRIHTSTQLAEVCRTHQPFIITGCPKSGTQSSLYYLRDNAHISIKNEYFPPSKFVGNEVSWLKGPYVKDVPEEYTIIHIKRKPYLQCNSFKYSHKLTRQDRYMNHIREYFSWMSNPKIPHNKKCVWFYREWNKFVESYAHYWYWIHDMNIPIRNNRDHPNSITKEFVEQTLKEPIPGVEEIQWQE